MTWTMENTEGFSQVDLDTINAVRAKLLNGFTGEEKSVDDAITNAWQDGIGHDELARKAMNLLINKPQPVSENWMDPKSWTDRAPNPRYRRSASDPE